MAVRGQRTCNLPPLFVISQSFYINRFGVWLQVRFGAAAVSRRLREPPASGMVQVNLDDDFTRTVMAS